MQKSPAADASSALSRGTISTSDGARLSYLEGGAGRPLVMIPGWAQTAAEFKYQLAELSKSFRVIAIDMRGHGESEKIDHGYRISRLAKDLHDALVALDLRDVALLGHSMGCSVSWCYWDMYGPERLSKLVLVDQAPFLTSNPEWTEAERRDAGAIFDAAALYDLCNQLAGPDAKRAVEGLIGQMVTKAMPEDEKTWITQQSLKLPHRSAADLLYNHATQDWRDVITRIDIPTLVIGGKASVMPWASQVWISKRIPGAHIEIFEEIEGGSHFPFVEAHDKFNRAVRDFIA